MSTKKEVIYIDVEDDITSIIDKITKADSSIIAAVLPKRANVLQSVVNMKLLKNAADKSKKKLVLITSESTLMPLAGSVQIHVAKSLQSKPEIPKVAEKTTDKDSVIEDDAPSDLDKSVGDLQKESKKGEHFDFETDDKGDVKKSTDEKTKKDKKGIKVPDFGKFRNKLLLGVGGLVAIIVLYVVGFILMPTATIDITAQTNRVDTAYTFKIDLDATEDNPDENIFAGETQEIKRTISEDFKATGEKNVGNKASGTVTITNNCFNPGTIPSGTSLTSNSGLEFVTTEDVALADATLSAGSCDSPSTADVAVQAKNAGDNYNLGPTGYSVGGYSTSDVSGSGGQMTGGTTKIETVVSQNDFNKAKNMLQDKDQSEIKDELIGQLGDTNFVIEETFEVKSSKFTSSPKVGETADNAKVNAEFTFVIVGVDKSKLEEAVKNKQSESIDTDQQEIIDAGLSSARTEIVEKPSDKIFEIELKTDGFAGPKIDSAGIAEEIAGKKFGEVESIVKSKAGVKSVNINFDPFWVFKAPRASRITVNINVEQHNLQ